MNYKNVTAIAFIISLLIGCGRGKVKRTTYFPKEIEKVKEVPDKTQTWVFILAGQSNMAGRGLVEPQDTVPQKNILTFDASGQLIYAKEPLHYYEPTVKGLDCGISFAKAILRKTPKNVTILLVPTAVGNTTIEQWLGDSVYRNVKLLTNFKKQCSAAQKFGTIKAILWLQGESDAVEASIPFYKERCSLLFTEFRRYINNDHLPILIGKLGSFAINQAGYKKINESISEYSKGDINSRIIETADLKGDEGRVHFNSEGQRILGQRYADAFFSISHP